MLDKMMIRNREWNIVSIDPKDSKHLDEESLGCCVPYERTIYINKFVKETMLMETIVHEWGHALMYEVGLNSQIADPIEEVIVENFAKEIIDFWFKLKEEAKVIKKKKKEKTNG